MDAVAVADALRVGIFGLFGVGAAFMVATNFIAFMVLRPAKRVGFLWWHVTSISVSFAGLGILALENIFFRFHHPASWRLVVGGACFALFCVAQIIIFNVEKSRYAQKTALEQGLAENS